MIGHFDADFNLVDLVNGRIFAKLNSHHSIVRCVVAVAYIRYVVECNLPQGLLVTRQFSVCQIIKVRPGN